MLARRRLIAGYAVEVPKRADELRQWHGIRGAALETDGALQVPACGFDLRQGVKGIDVTGQHRQRGAVLAPRCAEPAMRPIELAELGVRPRQRFGLTRGG